MNELRLGFKFLTCFF